MKLVAKLIWAASIMTDSIGDRSDLKADLHNQHVYLYFRYLGWVAEENNMPMRAFFMRDFARQELE